MRSRHPYGPVDPRPQRPNNSNCWEPFIVPASLIVFGLERGEPNAG
jgi:hypothetical protein